MGDQNQYDVSNDHLYEQIDEYRVLLNRSDTKLEVTTKIMQELMSFKQWVDHVYPNAVKEYDAVMVVGGEVIHIIE
jgi:hypothetical protein